MRLLIVTPYHAPAYAFGGPVRVIESTARAFLAAGHEVTVATTDVLDERRRLPADTAPLPPGARVVRFPNRSHRLAVRARGWTPAGWLPWIRAAAGDFDLVWLHDIYSVLSAGAARAAERAGVPYVVQPHGSAAIVAERGKPGAKRAFMALWGRRTLRRAAAVLYATSGERRDLLAHGVSASRVVELPPALDLPAVEHARAPGRARPTVVYLGRLDPIKGIDRLLEAIAIARQRLPELRLELVGPGETVRLEQLAGRLGLDGAVTFRGLVVDPAEKADVLGGAHLYCLLSHSEGLPVAALEAMACGTPVLLSAGCNLPEVDGRGGVVVSGAPREAADAIVALLGDPARRARLADGALRFAERYRAERVNAEALALAETLTADRAAR